MRTFDFHRSFTAPAAADDAVASPVPGRAAVPGGALARDARVPGRTGLDARAPSAAMIRAGAELVGGGPADPSAAAAIAATGVARASGRLPHHDRIQALFGRHDLGGVAVARDAAAASATAQLGARAFALGNRIALPSPGLWIEAHEAAHVVQQRAGRVASHGTTGDAHERHADAVADRVVAGESAEALLDEVAGTGGDAGGEHVQLFRTTSHNIDGGWGYRVTQGGQPSEQKGNADTAFTALKGALRNYEQGASIATCEAVLDTASAFLAAFQAMSIEDRGGLEQRVGNQANALINEARVDLVQQLDTVARTPVHGHSPERIVDDTIAQLGDNPDRRRDHRRLLRYQQEIGIQATRMDTMSGEVGPAILQSWQARGDMYHVRAVLDLFPQVKVILYDLPTPSEIKKLTQLETELDHATRWEQACMMADYYGQRDRVYYTHAGGVAKYASKNAAYELIEMTARGAQLEEMRGVILDVGGCTTVVGGDLLAARLRGHKDYHERRAQLARAVAPDPVNGDGRASAEEIRHYLADHGWNQGERYVIINFRDSGHSHIQKQIARAPQHERKRVIDDYNPVGDQIGGNHPDLDTGTVGVQQLAALVANRGFTPVFMGEEPSNADEPHLIRYWESKHVYGDSDEPRKLCRGGRAAEAFFVRTLAETYDVRLLSMRSGVTDQLAFLGMPTISIDVDNFHQAPVPELSKVPGYEMNKLDEVAHSWMRGSKLEAGLGRDYGRVFLQEQRPLNDFDDNGKWKGGFGGTDLDTIDDALGFYFGTRDVPAPESGGVRHSSHPFHPDKLETTEKHGRPEKLREALVGRLDTGLNPETVLEHMRAVLRGEPPDVKQAMGFADSQLHFMDRLDTRVRGKRDIDRQRGKLAYRHRFLNDVIDVLGPYKAADKYEIVLEQLQGLGELNALRRTAMTKALVALRDAIASPDLVEGDSQLAEQLLQIGKEIEETEAAIKLAGDASPVEQPKIQDERLVEIGKQLQAAIDKLLHAIGESLEREHDDTPRRRALSAARDALGKIIW